MVDGILAAAVDLYNHSLAGSAPLSNANVNLLLNLNLDSHVDLNRSLSVVSQI